MYFLEQPRGIVMWKATKQIHDEPRPESVAKECEIIIRVADRDIAEVDYASETSLTFREQHMLWPEIGMQERRGVSEVGIVVDERFKLGLDPRRTAESRFGNTSVRARWRSSI